MNKSDLRERIFAGVSANSLSQLVTIFIQLTSVPIFLSYMGIEAYGKWLIISAIPSYLALSDIGVVTASANNMTIAYSRNDFTKLNIIFQTAFSVVGAIGLVVLTVICLFVLILYNFFSYFQSSEYITIILLSIHVLLCLQCGLADAIFKSTGRYSTGTYISNMVRLFEWFGGIAGLIFFGNYIAIAAGYLIMRTIGFFILKFYSQNIKYGIQWKISEASLSDFKAILKSGLSFMAFPISSSLQIQGITILIGSTLSPTAVTIFNTYRTIARVTTQFNSILSFALWPELSRLYGSGDLNHLRNVYFKFFLINVIISSSLVLVIYFSAKWILKYWTHDSVEFIPVLMNLMLAGAFIGSILHLPKTLLMSTNNHEILAFASVIIAFGSVLILLLTANFVDLSYVSMILIISELLIFFICNRLIKNTLNIELLLR